MKIVFLHNDFRVYWKGRLFFLKRFLSNYNISINVIEIFGKGSPYSFDKIYRELDWWECLFIEDNLADLNKKKVAEVISQRLDEINPDFIICGSIVFTSGAIGVRWAIKNNKKIILFDDAKHSEYRRNIIVNYIKKYLTKQADAYLVPSTDYDSEYLKWGISKEKLLYGLNCIDNSFFSSKTRRLTRKSKTIICVARLVPIKNLQSLVHAWKTVEEQNNEYHLLIIGEGPEFNNLTQLIKKLELSKIKLLGYQDRRVIARLLAQSEAFILPSFLEGWGLVVNEAMAAGLPILVSIHINSAHTLLSNNVNGFSFDPYLQQKISDVILQFIALSNKEKTCMSRNALSRVHKLSYQFLGDELVKAINKTSTKKKIKTSFWGKIIVNSWSGKFRTSNWDILN